MAPVLKPHGSHATGTHVSSTFQSLPVNEIVMDIDGVLSQQRATIEEILAVTRVPGVSVGVLRDGKVVHEAHFGYRDVEAKLAPDTDTRYNINSLTKAILAAACSVLVQEGKLEWDTRLSKFFPQFADDAIASWITVEDLLSHRSGYTTPTSLWLQDHNIVLLGKDDVLPVFLRYAHKAHGRFRNSCIYNNYAYSIIGLLIEKISDQKLGDFLNYRLFEPLGMTRTTTEQLNPEVDDNTAKSYTLLEDESLFEISLVQYLGRDTAMEGAGGIKSCMRDMLLFYGKLMDQVASDLAHDISPLRDAKQLLEPRSFFDTTSLREETYALGWLRTQLPAQLGKLAINKTLVKELPAVGEGHTSALCIYHQGLQPGSCTSVYIFPVEKIAVVTLQNSAAPCDCASWIAQLCVQALYAKPGQIDYVALAQESKSTYMRRQNEINKELQSKRELGTKPSLPFTDYTGRYYDVSGKFYLEIRVPQAKEDHASSSDALSLELAFQGLDSQVHALSHYHNETFSWAMSHDEASKKGRLIMFVEPEYYLLTFSLAKGKVAGLYWSIERDLEADEPSTPELFVKH